MKKIRTTALQAPRDLYYAYVQFKEEQKIVQGVSYVFALPNCSPFHDVVEQLSLRPLSCWHSNCVESMSWLFTGEFLMVL